MREIVQCMASFRCNCLFYLYTPDMERLSPVVTWSSKCLGKQLSSRGCTNFTKIYIMEQPDATTKRQQINFKKKIVEKGRLPFSFFWKVLSLPWGGDAASNFSDSILVQGC